MGVLDDEFTPGTTQATTQAATSNTPSSSSNFTVSTTPTSIDVSGSSSSETLAGGSTSSSSSSTSTATGADPNAPEVKTPELRTISTYVNRRAGQPLFTTNSGVTVNVNIGDRTSTQGMTPKAMSILNAMAENAAEVGITQIDITAAKGGGHKSHYAGTEFDLKGYTSDGTLWTPEQRVAVAAAGASAGADRFGLYSFGKGFLGNGSLHIGYSGPGRPAAVWGFRGLTGGDGSRAFTNPAEQKFHSMFVGGSLSTGFSSFVSGGKLLRGDYLGDTQSGPVPDPNLRPDITSPAFGARGASELQGYTGPMTVAALGNVVLGDGRSGGRIIGKGEEGDHVAELQAFLNVQGVTDYYGNALVVDGKFGRLTRQAVKAYQTVSQIGVDGRVGPETYQAMLYDINPGAAVMPGDAAYRDGLRTATKIVDPAAEVVPLPRMRPDQGDGVPTPRTRADYYAYRLGRSAHFRDRYNDMMLRPGDMAFDPLPGEAPPASRAFEPAAEDTARPVLGPAGDPIAVDMAARQERARAMEAENDAYFAAQVEAGRTSRRAALIELATLRAGQGIGSQVFHEGQTGIAVDSAVSAGAAMRQRFDDAHAGADRFLPPAERPIDLGATLVRSAEAVRQFVRGIGDAYRKAIEQQRGLRPYDPFGTKSSTKDQSRVPTADAILKADPTPSSAVTTVYDFRRRP